jgi:hypothetical protein
MDVRSNKRRLSEQFPASAAESRSEKRAKTAPGHQLGPIEAPNCYDESAAQSVFQGVGVQHSGPGMFYVRGNLNIGKDNSLRF